MQTDLSLACDLFIGLFVFVIALMSLLCNAAQLQSFQVSQVALLWSRERAAREAGVRGMGGGDLGGSLASILSRRSRAGLELRNVRGVVSQRTRLPAWGTRGGPLAGRPCCPMPDGSTDGLAQLHEASLALACRIRSTKPELFWAT